MNQILKPGMTIAATIPRTVAEMKCLLVRLVTAGRRTPGAAQKNDVEVKRYTSESAARPKQKEKASE